MDLSEPKNRSPLILELVILVDYKMGRLYTIQLSQDALMVGNNKNVTFVTFITLYSEPLQTIAAYFRVNLGRLDKLQGKAFTHFCEVEWWRALMVECATVYLTISK